MKFIVNQQPGYATLTLQEERIDSSCSPQLKSELLAQHVKGVRNLILDLSEVKYTDSSGLSALLVGNRIFHEDGGSFVLAALSPHVLKLIKISQLETMLTLVGSTQEAVALVCSRSSVAENNGAKNPA